MRPLGTTVTTFPALLEWASEGRSRWADRHRNRSSRPTRQPWVAPWYRGASNLAYRLLPTLYRPNVAWDWRDPLVGEIDLRRDFARRAQPYLDSSTGNLRSAEDFYFAMQHHGMVTRLLDWTESLSVAAYFAVQNVALGEVQETDAALWMLDPLVLNERTAEVGYRMLTVESLGPYFPAAASSASYPDPVPEPPAAMVATSRAVRLAAQRGTFTIQGSMRIGVDEFEDSRTYLELAVIPRAAMTRIADELLTAGVSETTVYPDLDHLSKELRTRVTRPR